MNPQTIPLYGLDGREIEKVKLDADVFNGEINFDLLYQIKLMYQANLRQGNASTKTRGEVSGGAKKPWRQKGTGRARAGSIRSPIWRGGGKTFGPKPRSYYYRLPKKMVQLALKSCLNLKLKNNELRLIKDLNLEKPKTKVFADMMNKLKAREKSLILVKNKDANLIMASRNIAKVNIKDVKEVNAFDTLSSSELIMTGDALKGLIVRIKNEF